MQILYFLIWILGLLFVGLFELDVLAVNFLPAPTPEVLYFLQVLGIILTLGGTYLAIRIPHVLKRPYTALLQQILISVPIIYNMVLYYGLVDVRYGFCLLICAAGLVFCKPQKS